METNQKFGHIRTWITKKHNRSYGIISVSMCQRYFVRASDFAIPPDKSVIGHGVYFDVAPAEGDGKLPRAINPRLATYIPAPPKPLTGADKAGAEMLGGGSR